MKQIKLTDNNFKIPIYLASNTVLSGVSINANYDPTGLIAKLDSIADAGLGLVSGFRTATVNQTLKTISTYDEVITHFEDDVNKVFITGYTDSKFEFISKYIEKNNIVVFDIKSNSVKTYAGDGSGNTVVIPDDLTKNVTVRTKTPFVIPTLNSTVMILNEPLSGLNEYVLYLDTEYPIKYVDLGDGMSIFKYLRIDESDNYIGTMSLFEGIIDEPKIYSEVFIDRGFNTALENIKRLRNVKSINELNKIGLGFYKINTKGYNFKNL